MSIISFEGIYENGEMVFRLPSKGKLCGVSFRIEGACEIKEIEFDTIDFSISKTNLYKKIGKEEIVYLQVDTWLEDNPFIMDNFEDNFFTYRMKFLDRNPTIIPKVKVFYNVE